MLVTKSTLKCLSLTVSAIVFHWAYAVVEDPWADITARYPEGAKVKAKVTNLTTMVASLRLKL